jgi:hypothetical protein
MRPAAADPILLLLNSSALTLQASSLTPLARSCCLSSLPAEHADDVPLVRDAILQLPSRFSSSEEGPAVPTRSGSSNLSGSKWPDFCDMFCKIEHVFGDLHVPNVLEIF